MIRTKHDLLPNVCILYLGCSFQREKLSVHNLF